MTINRLNQGVTNQVLVKAVSGQTTPLLELQDSSGNVVSSIGPTGALGGTLGTSGLVHIATQSFSSVTTHSVTNVFSSTYDNYRIVGNLLLATNGGYGFRLRTAGSDLSTSSYIVGNLQVGATISSGFNSLNNSTVNNLEIGNASTTDRSGFVIDLINPNLALNKTALTQSSGRIAYWNNCIINSTTQADGFTFIAASNLTGTVSVYGYRK